MTIRPGKPSDLPRIREIEREAPTAAHWRDEDYLRLFDKTGPRRTVLVAEERGRVLGFLVAHIQTDEWEIENIVVAPEARRRRLASRLLTRLLDLASNANALAVVLEVRESNDAARALYKTAGFVEAGRRAKYYRNPDEDALVYRLML